MGWPPTVEDIEAIRREAGPSPCPTCGSTVRDAPGETKQCGGCRRVLPRSVYQVVRYGAGGQAILRPLCLTCQRNYERMRTRRRRQEARRAQLRQTVAEIRATRAS